MLTRNDHLLPEIRIIIMIHYGFNPNFAADESSYDVRSSFQRPTPPHLATSGTEMPT